MELYELKVMNGTSSQFLGIVEDPEFVDGIMTATKVGNAEYLRCKPRKIKAVGNYILEECTECLAEPRKTMVEQRKTSEDPTKQLVAQKRPFRN